MPLVPPADVLRSFLRERERETGGGRESFLSDVLASRSTSHYCIRANRAAFRISTMTKIYFAPDHLLSVMLRILYVRIVLKCYLERKIPYTVACVRHARVHRLERILEEDTSFVTLAFNCSCYHAVLIGSEQRLRIGWG